MRDLVCFVDYCATVAKTATCLK